MVTKFLKYHGGDVWDGHGPMYAECGTVAKPPVATTATMPRRQAASGVSRQAKIAAAGGLSIALGLAILSALNANAPSEFDKKSERLLVQAFRDAKTTDLNNPKFLRAFQKASHLKAVPTHFDFVTKGTTVDRIVAPSEDQVKENAWQKYGETNVPLAVRAFEGEIREKPNSKFKFDGRLRAIGPNNKVLCFLTMEGYESALSQVAGEIQDANSTRKTAGLTP